MRGVLIGLVLVLLGPFSVCATDYVYISVNGDTSAASMTSGDTLAFGCNVSGRGVWWEVLVDLDLSGDVSPPDKFLLGMRQVDQDFWFGYGVPDGDSAVGWVRIDIGSAGLVPGYTYVARATDEDASSAYDTAFVLPLASPGGMISGNVRLNGVVPPDSAMALIEVEASLGAMGGFWTAFTDTMGDYSIEVDSGGLGKTYSIGPTDDIFPYITPEPDTATLLDTIANMDYLYALAAASVVGSVVDDIGDSLPRGLGMEIESPIFGRKDAGLHLPGRYFVCLGVPELGDWSLGFSGFGLLPFYLIPPSHDVTVGLGDSLVEDFIVYRADTTIPGSVTIAGTVPLDTFHFMIAECETSGVGIAYDFCDSMTGVYELGVNSADTLTWRVAVDPPFGNRMPGFVVENGFARLGVHGGDTVNFNFVPATDTIGGQISFHTSVPGSLQFPLDTLGLLSIYWKTPIFPFDNVAGFAKPDTSGVYSFPSEPDTYAIFCMDFPDTNYYTVPYYYDSLIIDGDTDTLDFVIHHKSVGVAERDAGGERRRMVQLWECSPNPFAGGTVIRAFIPEQGNEIPRVSVYDLSGSLVRVLSEGESGHLTLRWHGRDADGHCVPAGVYFIRIEASGLSTTRKAVLLR